MHNYMSWNRYFTREPLGTAIHCRLHIIHSETLSVEHHVPLGRYKTNKQTRKTIANFLANSILAGKTGMILRHTEKIFCLTMLNFHPM